MKSRDIKLHGYARGGKIHSDAAEDRKIIKGEIDKAMSKDKAEDKKMIAEAVGNKAAQRLDKYKRGGRTKSKKKGGDTKITIVNAPMAKDKQTPVPVPVPVSSQAPAGQTPIRQMPPTVPAGVSQGQGMPMIRKCGGRTR